MVSKLAFCSGIVRLGSALSVSSFRLSVASLFVVEKGSEVVVRRSRGPSTSRCALRASLRMTAITLRLPAAVGGFRQALGAAEEHEGDGLLGVHAVFGLVEDDGLRAVEDGVGDFRAAVRGQAVHEGGAGLRVAHELIVDLEGNEDGSAAGGLVLLAHGDADVGIDGVGAGGGLD